MRFPRFKSAFFRIIIAGIILYIFARLFIFDVYFIRSSSMRSTLFEGDYVLVNKFFLNDIERFDVFVFAPPAPDSAYGSVDYYIKRCVGMPGDTIEIKNGTLAVNGIQYLIPTLQYNYTVITNGTELPTSLIKRLGAEEKRRLPGNQTQSLFMTTAASDSIRGAPGVLSVSIALDEKEYCDATVFPGDKDICWNFDHFGPLIVPKKGLTLEMNPMNVLLYGSVIRLNEKKSLRVSGDSVWIGGKYAQEYSFESDYYFAMGDNRHFSSDSRVWGFLPAENVNGSATMIIYSEDPDESQARWERMFTIIH